MKTKRKVPVTPEYVEFMPEVEEMEEGVIYICLDYDVTGHRCLCGCGMLTILPIKDYSDNPDIKAASWNMTDDDGKLTFTPSVGNFQYPCKSHYIITKGVANIV